MEVDDLLVEVESFNAGYMKLLCADDSTCMVGDLIGKMVLDEIEPSFRTLPLYLSGSEIAELDAMRGDVPIEIFIRETMLSVIENHAK